MLKLNMKNESYTLFAAVFYLPPKFSTRQIDVGLFYECLLSEIYEFQNQGRIYTIICGDFHGRVGSLYDFI
jgi:hypothetical protein